MNTEMKKIYSVIILVCFIVSQAGLAYCGDLPEGMVIESGSATVDYSVPDRVNITALSLDTIFNCTGGFNIGQNHSVYVYLPSNDGRVLFKDSSGNPTVINGNLSSGYFDALGSFQNGGWVVIVNPIGITFGSTADVDIGNLIASTLSISNTNFLARNYTFEKNYNKGASVLNKGNITARQGGFIALLSDSAENDGVIIARQGTITLASGKKMTLSFDNDKLIDIVIDKETDKKLAGVDDAILNIGTLEVDSGLVLLKASIARNLFRNAVNNSGIIAADSAVEGADGKITLAATRANIYNSGTISTDGDVNISTTDDISINSGTVTAKKVDIDCDDLSIVSGGRITSQEHDIGVTGGWDSTGGQFNGGVGTVNFIGNSSKTRYVKGETTFYNLLFSGNYGRWYISNNLAVTNNLTITNTASGTNMRGYGGNRTISVGGDVIHSGRLGIDRNVTILMNGTRPQFIETSNTGSLGSLRISNTSGGVRLMRNLRLNIGSITIDPNAIFSLAGYNIMNCSSVINNGTLRLFGNESLPTPQNRTGSVVEYIATSGAYFIKNWLYETLKINGPGGVFRMNGNLTLGKDLVVTAGTFDANNKNLSINGNTTINGGVMKAGTGRVVFGNGGEDNVFIDNGELHIQSDNVANDIVVNAGNWNNTGGTIFYDATSPVSTKLIPGLSTYNNLVFNSLGSIYALNGSIDVDGDFVISNGTVKVDSPTPCQINLAGNWDNRGAFDAGPSTLLFDGADQNVTGSTTFNNLEKTGTGSLTFQAGSTQAIDGMFSMKGIDGNNRLILQSSQNGNMWNIKLTGGNTYNLDYLDVKDSNNLGQTIYNDTSIFTNCKGWDKAPAPAKEPSLMDITDIGNILFLMHDYDRVMLPLTEDIESREEIEAYPYIDRTNYIPVSPYSITIGPYNEASEYDYIVSVAYR